MTDIWQDDLGTAENPKSDRERKFWEYHAENPHIYEAFDRFAQEAVKSQRDTFGAQTVVERVRWYCNFEESRYADTFKINNNFSGYYGRLWMRNNPQHRGLFRRRKLRAKHAPATPSAEALAYL